MTTAEAFWYVLGCVYVPMNIFFGSGQLSKVIVKKAMSEVRYASAATSSP
jgi:hypothetical protein